MKALIFRETGEPKSLLKLAELPTPPLAPEEPIARATEPDQPIGSVSV